MINAIEIENFKGIGSRQRIVLAPITLLFGGNSAGKSTLLHAIMYFRSLLLSSGKMPNGAFFCEADHRLGGFGHLVNEHNPEKSVSILVEVSVSTDDLPEKLRSQTSLTSISLELTVKRRHTEIVVERRYFANRKLVIHDTNNQDVVFYNNIPGPPQLTLDILPVVAKVSPLERAMGIYKFSAAKCEPTGIRLDVVHLAQLTNYFNSWTSFINMRVEQHVSQMLQLSPIRETPRMEFQYAIPPVDNKSISTGLYAWDLLLWMTEPELGRVNDWMGADGLDLGYCVQQRKINGGNGNKSNEERRIELFRISKTNEQSALDLTLRIQDVGVGVSQVIPILTHCLSYRNENCLVPELVTIEQPELHLHPRAQARLGDLFAFTVHTGDELDLDLDTPKQIIAETHSEYLILRIMRRIRETSQGRCPEQLRIMSTGVSIIFVDKAAGESNFQRIHISDNGEFIEPWPDDFFEVDFQERFS